MNTSITSPRIIVAIDGFSSSGKSTMARRLAAKVGYRYIDSGAMYRAVALYALEHGMCTPEGEIDTAALESALPSIAIDFVLQPDGSQHTTLNGVDVEADIRTLRVSSVVSPVSAIAAVRRRLTAMQQALGAERGIVMDGRDIGTTVFPQAEMKVFVDASPEERARRRLKELQQKGEETDYDSVLANIRERDHIDSTREVSPLRKADDAHVLDNDRMTPAEQMEWLLNLYNSIINEG